MMDAPVDASHYLRRDCRSADADLTRSPSPTGSGEPGVAPRRAQRQADAAGVWRQSPTEAPQDAPGVAQSQAGQPVAAIILAAGRSSRMGEHKLLLPLGGKPLLDWSVEAALASSARPLVVALGRDADALRAALPAGDYTTVVNPRYAQGMGTSLALAVSMLVAQFAPDILGTLILLADQPLMTPDIINAVLRAALGSPERIAMARYPARPGHPVYLPRRLFPRIQSLNGDQGARQLIAEEQGALTWVTVADERALLDVDTPEDYQRAQSLLAARDHLEG